MIDINEFIGKKFGRLTVIEDLGIFAKEGNTRKSHYVKCMCDCGNECIVEIYKLKNGHTSSCGCISKEGLIERNKKFKWSRLKKRYNEYYIVGDVTYVRYGDSYDCFVIDTEYLDKIKNYYWIKDRYGYAISQTQQGILLVHKLIMDSQDGYEVDHINGNGTEWDNRKSNLRICTHMQNTWNSKTPSNNTSGHKGVSWNKLHKKWESYITYNGKRIHLGLYSDIKDAIEARKHAEIKYFGEYSRDYGYLVV